MLRIYSAYSGLHPGMHMRRTYTGGRACIVVPLMLMPGALHC
jgi:hypothetical protein